MLCLDPESPDLTRRLYYDDSYRLDFEARAEGLENDEDGRPVVILDATFFYPTSGGQMHDRGMLGGVPVVDVIDRGAKIHHVLAAAPVCGGRRGAGQRGR